MASVNVALSESYADKFQLVHCSKLENVIPVFKYKCLRTGLTIVFGDIEGPLVQGYFNLATEAFDDDGIPHTLEHLIFLGSEDYPFKGVLDLLANRCLASGTNAWTAVDHTCYTVCTAGSEGFLSLLPVYLDHVLYPTLKDAGFITEVHHITYDAEDAGVVYCEMQGRENSGESIVERSLLQKLYPGKCGYKSETGGIMKNLRESTTNKKIGKYHHQFYRPENLLLNIFGKVDHSSVFDALEPFIQKILSKGKLEDYVRPWQSPVEPMTESSNYVELYPSDEETNGLLYVAWRGPNSLNEYIACQLLMRYLTDTPISPLPKEMVEIPDPYCSEVAYYMSSHNEPFVIMNFENVPVEKMDAETIPSKLNEVFVKLMNDVSYFDLERLRTFIERYELNVLSSLDNCPHEALCTLVIEDFLNGKHVTDLEQRLNKISILKQLHNEDLMFWKDILEKYFINGPRVVVRGIPSIKKQEELAAEEKKRIQDRKETMGEDGLKQKAFELLNAKKECEIKPTKELLTSVKIPDIECIQFYSYDSYSTNSVDQHKLFNVTDAPIYMEVDNIKSNFVYMYAFINTNDLSLDFRMYLPIIVDLFMESTVVCDDVKIHYTDIIAELEKDIIVWNSEIGMSASRFLCGTFSSVISLFFQIEPKKFDKGIKWLRNFLYNTEITKEKFNVSLLKLINEVSCCRRDGNYMLKDILRNIVYNKSSNHYASSTLRQHTFLTNILKKIESDEGWSAVNKDLNEIKMILANPSNIKVHISGNLDTLCETQPNASSLLKELVPTNVKSSEVFKTVFDHEYILSKNECTVRACAVGMGAIESSYFTQVTDCISDYNHPDLAALLIFVQYFTQLEGPMWRKIRGFGYAYSYSINPQPNEALISLHFYRSVNVPAAYKETKAILEGHLNDSSSWDQTLFESAVSSMIFEIVDREKSIGDLISQSVLLNFRNLSPDYNQALVKKLSKVKLEELPAIGKRYVMPLFDPNCTRTAMVCPPSKLEEVSDEFKKMGINMTTYKSLDESLLNSS